MKLPMFSVFDAKLNAYMRPFVMQAKGQAMRGFGDEVQNAQSDMHKHPEDYSLWTVGFFDEDTGELNPKKPERIALATDFVPAKVVN